MPVCSSYKQVTEVWRQEMKQSNIHCKIFLLNLDNEMLLQHLQKDSVLQVLLYTTTKV